MRTENTIAKISNNPSMDYNQILSKEGVYKPVGEGPNSKVRLVVIKHIDAVVLYVDDSVIQPASRLAWQKHKFIKVADTIQIIIA